MWVSPNLIYGHCMKIITKQLRHSSKLQSTLSTPHSQRATSWVLTCTSFSLWAQDCESRWHAILKVIQKNPTINLLFHFAGILYKKHEEQEYAANDRDSRNDLWMLLRCRDIVPQWSTGELQKHLCNTGRSLQVK